MIAARDESAFTPGDYQLNRNVVDKLLIQEIIVEHELETFSVFFYDIIHAVQPFEPTFLPILFLAKKNKLLQSHRR